MLEIYDESLHHLASKLKSGLLTPLDLVENHFDRVGNARQAYRRDVI